MKWKDTDTQPIPIRPSQRHRLTPDEAHLIERGLDTWHDLTGTPRQQPIIPQPRPWPKTTAPGTGRRRRGIPTRFGRAIRPSRARRLAYWLDVHSLWIVALVALGCCAVVIGWGL